MSIERLRPEEWQLLASIYRDEFRSGMPDRAAAILVDREGERLKGFVALESVIWLPELYVFPEYRGGRTAARLLKFVERRVKGRTILCTPDSLPVERMCKAFGMRRINGAIYRKAVV